MDAAPGLLDALETLIAPGRRSRLSPFVEAAQFCVLFDEVPDIQRRVESSRELLGRHAARIQQIASRWSSFAADDKPFAERDYADRDFLDAYLAYYFSVNVPKIQLVLFDLLRHGELPRELRLLDLGVGTGTTIVAVLDFLVALGTVCDLFGQPFPVSHVELIGADRSSSARAYASRMVDAYRSALEARLGIRPGLAPSDALRDTDPLQRVVAWAESVRWIEHDLQDGLPFLTSPPTLVVASNVLNELPAEGQRALALALGSLPARTVCAILEPGAEANARQLMKWRRRSLFADGRFVSLGPCGQELGATLSRACDACWNARREGFHQTALYAAVRDAIHPPAQGSSRRYDPHENRLLSWSYMLARRFDAVETPVVPAAPLPNGAVMRLTTRYVGTYRRPSGSLVAEPYAESPDASRTASGAAWRDLLKCCPASTDSSVLVFERSPGFEVPRLHYGDEITLTNVQVSRAKNGRWLRPQPDGTRVESVNHHPAALPSVESGQSGFLPAYDERTRRGIDEVAYRLFGFPSMHGFQHEILSRVLQGRSMLGIAATGGGKSECFILPSLLLPGITVVVSPLKALMTDQYEQRIRDRYGLEHLATYINGDVPMAERQARLSRLTLGQYKLVYVTPEQLEQSWVLDLLARAHERIGIRYLALDEAHCISQWGHDFRPSYLNLTRRLRAWGIEPVRIALTATASPRARDDICDELNLNPVDDVYVDSSNRPELNLVVRVRRTTGQKSDEIVDELRQLLRRNAQEPAGAAIVFMPHTGGDDDGGARDSASTPSPRAGRQNARVTAFASYLERQFGERVAIYHGKMDYDRSETAVPDASETDSASAATEATASADAPEERPLGEMSGRTRRDQQSAFIKDDRAIMVATKGFGMGVDKPNVRLVIHRTPTENLEAYAQEAGRAGRDGEPATVILFFSPDQQGLDEGRRVQSDHEIQRFFLDSRYIRRQDVVAIWELLRSARRRLRIRSEADGKIRDLLYVTSDEAIHYLDRLHRDSSSDFRWPSRSPRPSHEPTNQNRPGSTQVASPKYEDKCRYVQRILSVLQRIRPMSGSSGQRAAFVESFHQVGARVEGFREVDWRSLIGSNRYFGRVIRESGLAPAEFVAELRAPDLFALAERLSLSMRDLVSLLYDIRDSEARSALLRFWRIVPPETSPGRDVDAGRSAVPAMPSQWRTDAERKGWEIEPGPAFWDERLFRPYLDAFMSLHDRRRDEDEAAYARLLTDYIGVTADGQLRDGRSEGRCLREVMLGYLKTYEVVEGGNCLSCSRCVPNERFDASIEQRKRTVVKLGRIVEKLLEELERKATETPSVTLMAELVTVTTEEQRLGRGLTGYVIGWSNRLLADTPEHRGALWTRLQLMKSELVTFDADEFGRTLLALAELQPSHDDARRLLRFIDEAPASAVERATLRLAEATLCRRVADVDREIQALVAARGLATGAPDRVRLSTVLNRLRALWAPDGFSPDSAGFVDVTLELAEIAESHQVALDLYRSVMASWDGPRLKEHLTDLRDRDRFDLVPVVASAWLGIVSGPHDARRLEVGASVLEQVDPSMLERLADGDLALVWPFLSEQHQPGLAIRVARQLLERGGADVYDTFDAVDVISRAASTSVPVPSDLRQLTAERVLRDLPALAQDPHLADQLVENPVGTDILTRAAILLPHRDAATVNGWVSFVGVERMVRLGDRVIVGTMRAIAKCFGRSSSLRQPETRARLLDVSTRLRQLCEESGLARGEVRALWRDVLLKSGDALPALIERCLAFRPARTVLAYEAYETMLACTPPGEIRRFFNRLESSQPGQVTLRFALGKTCLDLLSELCSAVGGLATLEARPLLQSLVSTYRTRVRIVPEEQRPHLADMVHAIMVSQFAASVGPRARRFDLEVEALCQGYRFDEAAEIARQRPQLLVGEKRTSARQHVEQAARSAGTKRRAQTDSYESDYLAILQRWGR